LVNYVVALRREDIMQKWIVLWLASLAVVAGFIALMRAQAPSQVPPPFTSQAPPAPRVVSGADIGFRVEGNKDGRAVGTLVVRINGQWVETAASLTARQLTAK
jgi:hypothetical protein